MGCEHDHGDFCRMGARFEVLEKRMDDLESGQEREEAFRKTYQEDREARLVRDALLDKKIERMDAKLDTLLSYKSEQESKPNKLVDGIKDKLIGGIVASVAIGIVAAAVWLIKTLA